MTASPNRVFALILSVALTVVGLGALLLLVLLAPSIDAARTRNGLIFCLIAPLTSLDTVTHFLAVAIVGVGLLGLAAAMREANRGRATTSELRFATRLARRSALPPEVACVAAITGVTGCLDVVESPRPFAFAYGWVRPRIFLSTALVHQLDARELEAVLHHERWHVRHRDPLRLLVLRTIAATFFFLPALRRLLRQFEVAAEVAADRQAVASMGDPRWLAAALAKTSGVPLVTPAFEGYVGLRIAALAGEPLTISTGRWRLAAVCLTVEIGVLLPLLARGGLPVLAGILVHPMC